MKTLSLLTLALNRTGVRVILPVQSACLIPKLIVFHCFNLLTEKTQPRFFIVMDLNAAAVIMQLPLPANAVTQISTGSGVVLKNGKIKTT